MTTTTVRVDVETHRRLLAMSKRSGKQLIDVVRDATDALELVRYGATVRSELDELRSDPQAWADYLADGEQLPVGDGIA